MNYIYVIKLELQFIWFHILSFFPHLLIYMSIVFFMCSNNPLGHILDSETFLSVGKKEEKKRKSKPCQVPKSIKK